MASKKRAPRKKADSPDVGFLEIPFEEPAHMLTLVDDRHPAVWILGHRMQEIVGEYSYEHSLDAVVARLSSVGRARRVGDAVLGLTIAWLVPEPTNPVDPTATAVYLDNVLCGYFSREANQRWGPIVRRFEARHRRRVACTAVIVGLFEGLKGVWLMLDTGIVKEQFRVDHILGGDDLKF